MLTAPVTIRPSAPSSMIFRVCHLAGRLCGAIVGTFERLWRRPQQQDGSEQLRAWLDASFAESGRGRGVWPMRCGACGEAIRRPEDALMESRPEGDEVRDPRVIHAREASPAGGCAREGHVAHPLIWFMGTALAEWYWHLVAEGQGADQPEWAALGAALGQWTPSPLLAPQVGEAVH
jgi:hypothetical protein